MSVEQKVEQNDVCPEFVPLGKDAIAKAWGGSKEGKCGMCLEDVESGVESGGFIVSCTSDNGKDFKELRAPGITGEPGTLVADEKNIPPEVPGRTKNSSCPWINAYYYESRRPEGLEETPQT